VVEEKAQTMQSTETTTTESLVSETIANLKKIPTEKDLTTFLNEGILVVTFNKLDGDERVMTCTKSTEIIPKESLPKTNTPPKAQGLVTVWDVNAKGWRSFKYDRVTKVEHYEI
jgi:hypothetical protein